MYSLGCDFFAVGRCQEGPLLDEDAARVFDLYVREEIERANPVLELH